MKWSMINHDRVPRPGKSTTGKSRESDRLVAELVEGKVAKVELGDGESLRGLKASITRAGNRAGRKVHSWDHDGVLYVELA